MTDKSKEKAADYRRQAAACLDAADRLSMRVDRERMLDMAVRWLDLAKKAEQDAKDEQDSN